MARLAGAFLRRELSEVSHSQQAVFCLPLHRARQHLARTLRAFHDRLAEHVKAALGSRSPRANSPSKGASQRLRRWTRLRPATRRSPLGWLILFALFRRPIERVLLRKARWEVDKNLSRLAADWRDCVAAGINDSTRQAEQQAPD